MSYEQPKNLSNRPSPEEWENRIAELRQLLHEAIKNNPPIEISEKIYQFANKIEKKYPDYLRYRLFHLLIGSTPKEEHKQDKWDFPGKDSIENFIRNL